MNDVVGGGRLLYGKIRDLQRPERGQALMEMAVVLPLLIVLLLGIIEVGRYAELAIVVANAARAGAVYGAQNLAAAASSDAIVSAAQTDANLGTGLQVTSWTGLIGANMVVMSCHATPDVNNPLPYVIVQTSYTANSLFSNTPFTLRGCAQMQVAQ